MNPSEAEQAKNRELGNWTRAAPGWHKHDARLRAIYEPVTRRMLDAAQVSTGKRVLDIACGTGEPAIPAAERVGPTGHVLGTDLVEEMLAFGREKAAARGLRNLELRRVDGEALDVPAGSFDAVLIRWGIMFMPDPLACLVRARAALRPGGRIAVACWAGPDRNPWATIPITAIKRHVEVPPPPPGAPGLYAFADAGRLRGILEQAGFQGVELSEVEVVNSGFADGVELFTCIREISGPIAQLLAQLSPAQQRQVEEEVAREAEAYRAGATVGVPGVTWVAEGYA